MSIACQASCTFLGTDTRVDGLTPSVGIPVNLPAEITFSDGVGALQSNVVFQDLRTFSGTTDVLNLTAGLLDMWKTAIVAVRIKGVFFVNTGVDPIEIGAGTTPVVTWLNATGTLTLPPGAWIGSATPDATGWVVTASTAMNLTVTGTSGQTYKVILFLANA